MQLFNNTFRVRAALGLLLVGLTSVSGCSFMGECLRYESRTVQVCQRMEANGHCAHYGMRTQNYCAERARNDRLY